MVNTFVNNSSVINLIYSCLKALLFYQLSKNYLRRLLYLTASFCCVLSKVMACSTSLSDALLALSSFMSSRWCCRSCLASSRSSRSLASRSCRSFSSYSSSSLRCSSSWKDVTFGVKLAERLSLLQILIKLKQKALLFVLTVLTTLNFHHT